MIVFVAVCWNDVVEDGAEVPDALVQELAEITNTLKVPIQWQSGDIVMLDKPRFMRGRNPIGDPRRRRIYTQFGYAAFALPDYPNIDQHPWRRLNGYVFNI